MKTPNARWTLKLTRRALADLDALPDAVQDALIALLTALRDEVDLEHACGLDIGHSYPHGFGTCYRVKRVGGNVRAVVRVVDGGVVLRYEDVASAAAFVEVVFVARRSEATYREFASRLLQMARAG